MQTKPQKDGQAAIYRGVVPNDYIFRFIETAEMKGLAVLNQTNNHQAEHQFDGASEQLYSLICLA